MILLLTITKKIYKKILSIFETRKTLTNKQSRAIIKTKEEQKIKKTKENSVQKLIPISEIKEKGIIKLKNEKYIKIIKVIPINYELKSELEKESILNSYKTFLKSCNFNLQILIQSKKENLEKHIFILEQEKKRKNTKDNIIYDHYINYIKKINSENNSSSKNFFIIINNKDEINLNNPQYNSEKLIIDNLNEKYFKIKENLSRCGNFVCEIEKKETIDILYSFFNNRKKYIN